LLIVAKTLDYQSVDIVNRYYPFVLNKTDSYHELCYGVNIMLSESCIVQPAQLSINIHYWLHRNKHSDTRQVLTTRDKASHHLILLLLAGIEPNPGPRQPRFPCGICNKACKLGVIACDDCDKWIHKSCLDMTTQEFNDIGYSEESWICPACSKPNNSSSILYNVPTNHQNVTSGNISLNPSTNSSSNISKSTSSNESTVDTCTSSFHENSMHEPIMTSSPKPINQRNWRTQMNHKRNSMRILVINFQSLRKKGKLLEAIIETTNPDIIIGSETWLDPSIKSSEIIPEYLNFDIERRDRPTDSHGGVLIAAKKELLLGDIHRSKTLELISGTVETEGKKLRIVSYYRPPKQTSETDNKECKEEIAKIRSKRKNDIFVMGGDFNLPDINWADQSIKSNQYPVNTNQTYLDIAADNGLEQIVDFPTRKDNTLDLIFTSHPSFKQRCKPLPSIGNSDHDIVLLDIKPPKPKPARRKIYLWKKADIFKTKQDLQEYANHFLNKKFTNIESMWEDFKHEIHKIINNRVPTKLTKPRNTHPWMNTKIRKKINQKHRAHTKARRTKLKRDKDRYKRLQQEVQKDIRRANKQYMTDVISDKDNSNRLWSYIKSKGQEFIGVAPLKNQQGFLQSDNQSKANILNDQFKSVFTREDHTNFPDKGPSPHPVMQKIKVTTKGVFNLLNQQKPHKATGPDDIPAAFLKSTAAQLAPILTRIYQSSLDIGEVPQDWRNALVVPIFKKGERHIAANYRPVSLTSISCKILEHIIHSSIMRHFDANNILTDTQHGFRKKRSCETQLIVSIQEIAKRLAKGNQVSRLLTDFVCLLIYEF